MSSEGEFLCEEHRCVVQPECSEDLECWAVYSGWNADCWDQQDCPGQACIDIGDEQGKCAVAPSDFFMCETLMQHEVLMPPIEGGAPVTVCGATDYTCNAAGLCERPCRSDDDCELADGTPICNTDTGVCHCSSDEDCLNSGVPGYAICRDGTCGCGEDADCAGKGDACLDGLCTCSASDTCNPQHDGTTPVCQTP